MLSSDDQLLVAVCCEEKGSRNMGMQGLR